MVKKRKEKEILLHNPYMFMCSFYIRVYSFGMGANTFWMNHNQEWEDNEHFPWFDYTNDEYLLKIYQGQ